MTASKRTPLKNTINNDRTYSPVEGVVFIPTTTTSDQTLSYDNLMAQCIARSKNKKEGGKKTHKLRCIRVTLHRNSLHRGGHGK